MLPEAVSETKCRTVSSRQRLYFAYCLRKFEENNWVESCPVAKIVDFDGADGNWNWLYIPELCPLSLPAYVQLMEDTHW